MLLLVITTLVLTIPLASYLLSPIFPTGRFAFLITLYCTLLLLLLDIILYMDIELLRGLFQLTFLFKIPFILGGFSFIEGSEILFSMFVPIMIYSNVDSDKLRILSENEDKSGIYLWTHKESGRIYVGSAVNLSKRIKDYFLLSYINNKNKGDSHIYNAIKLHGHSAFSLSILEFINISSLSKYEEQKKLILEREQYYLDLIFSLEEPNTYNILRIAGSTLGLTHSEKTKALMSLVKSGQKNPMFGKTGEDSSFFGKSHSSETITKISETLTGRALSAETKALIGLAHRGKTLSEETKALFNKKVFVYSFDSDTKKIILFKSFSSCREAAKYFDCSTRTISSYLDKGKLYKKQWMLFSSEQ